MKAVNSLRTVPPFVTPLPVLRISGWSDSEPTRISKGRLLLIKKYSCVVYDCAGKADRSYIARAIEIQKEIRD